MKVAVILLVTMVAMAAGMPKLPTWFKRGLHHLVARQPEPACVRASDAAGRLLDFKEYWPPTMYLQDITFEEFMSHVCPFDVFDQSQREQFFCRFEGLSTVSDAVEALDELYVFQNSLKNMYAYGAVMAKLSKQHLAESIQNPSPWNEDCTELYELLLKLTRDLEASGFMDQEPEFQEFYTRVTLSSMPPGSGSGNQIYVPEPPSELPFDQQCSTVANDVRKLWNKMVKDASEYDPNMSQYLRDQIYEWSGIGITGHGQMQSLICNVLDATIQGGVDGLYELLRSLGVFEQACQTGYPIVRGLMEGFIQMQNGPTPAYQYQYPGYSYNGPDDPSLDLQNAFYDLMLSIRDMGVLSLN